MTDTMEICDLSLGWAGPSKAMLLPGTRCAWSARAIFNMDGAVDLLPDRQDMDGAPEHRAELAAWLNAAGLSGMKANVRRWLDRREIDTRTERMFLLYHDHEGSIFGTPNASAGYLYICAFLERHLPEGCPTRGLDRWVDYLKAREAEERA